MNGLESYNYNENSGFISQTRQINHHVDLFRIANERAISANTEAIKDQTNRLESVISAQTIQQKDDARLGRENISNLFVNLISTVRSIFSSKNSENTESYFDMMQRENNETQLAINATNSAITANTSSISQKLQNVINELNNIEGEIKSSASGNTVNSNGIKDAISNLELVVNNEIRP